MGKPVRSFKVRSLNNVDTTRYKEGDFFITNRSVGMLINGKIKTFATSFPNLKEYVKRDELEKMINDIINKEGVEND